MTAWRREPRRKGAAGRRPAIRCWAGVACWHTHAPPGVQSNARAPQTRPSHTSTRLVTQATPVVAPLTFACRSLSPLLAPSFLPLVCLQLVIFVSLPDLIHRHTTTKSVSTDSPFLRDQESWHLLLSASSVVTSRKRIASLPEHPWPLERRCIRLPNRPSCGSGELRHCCSFLHHPWSPLPPDTAYIDETPLLPMPTWQLCEEMQRLSCTKFREIWRQNRLQTHALARRRSHTRALKMRP